jgi:hypothetical protein
MDNDSGQSESWVRLIREVIASWPLVFRAVVLLLASTPVAVGVAAVFFFAR